MRQNLAPMVIFLLGILFFATMGYVVINSMIDCSWSDWLMYGRNLGWAWMTGYCSG